MSAATLPGDRTGFAYGGAKSISTQLAYRTGIDVMRAVAVIPIILAQSSVSLICSAIEALPMVGTTALYLDPISALKDDTDWLVQQWPALPLGTSDAGNEAQ